MNPKSLLTSIRRWVIFFIIALALSGITAFALETELNWLVGIWPADNPIYPWLTRVDNAIKDTNAHYPFMAYGYDWLAFAHLVIAMAFIGVLRDPFIDDGLVVLIVLVHSGTPGFVRLNSHKAWRSGYAAPEFPYQSALSAPASSRLDASLIC